MSAWFLGLYGSLSPRTQRRLKFYLEDLLLALLMILGGLLITLAVFFAAKVGRVFL